jgi:hypothetical protein
MSNGKEFRHYADEARGWAAQSKTQEERRTLVDLAAMWTLAAVAWDRVLMSGPEAPRSAPLSNPTQTPDEQRPTLAQAGRPNVSPHALRAPGD